MYHREELEQMLEDYENYVGMGNMKQAGRLLPKIIRKVVVILENKIGKPQLTELQKEYQAHLKTSPPPCEPCDVSLENNDKLIPEFKALTPSKKELKLNGSPKAKPGPKPKKKEAESLVKIEGRKTFRVDVGNLTPEKAVEYVAQARENAKNATTVPAPKTRKKPGPKPKKLG